MRCLRLSTCFAEASLAAEQGTTEKKNGDGQQWRADKSERGEIKKTRDNRREQTHDNRALRATHV
jgi:hypothetical protein